MGKLVAPDNITWRSDDGVMEVAVEEWSHEDGRVVYGWNIAKNDIVICTHHSSDDAIRGGHGAAADCIEALKAFSSFMTAWAEAMEYDERNPGRDSENSDLFPASAMPFLDYEQELYMDTHSEDFMDLRIDPRGTRNSLEGM